MDPFTIIQVMRKLLKQGLIQRRPSWIDRQLSIIILTYEGAHYTLDRLKHSVEVGQRLLAWRRCQPPNR